MIQPLSREEWILYKEIKNRIENGQTVTTDVFDEFWKNKDASGISKGELFKRLEVRGMVYKDNSKRNVLSVGRGRFACTTLSEGCGVEDAIVQIVEGAPGINFERLVCWARLNGVEVHYADIKSAAEQDKIYLVMKKTSGHSESSLFPISYKPKPLDEFNSNEEPIEDTTKQVESDKDMDARVSIALSLEDYESFQIVCKILRKISVSKDIREYIIKTIDENAEFINKIKDFRKQINDPDFLIEGVFEDVQPGDDVPSDVEIVRRRRMKKHEKLEVERVLKNYRGGITAEKYASRFNTSVDTAESHLKTLKDKGYMSLIGTTDRGQYVYRCKIYDNQLFRRTQINVEAEVTA